MKLYYLHEDGEDSGPFTLGQLRSMWQAGKITVATNYFCEGMDGWRELADMVPILEGRTEPSLSAARTWNPGVAAVMSFFIPGLGQLYKGQFGAALGFFFGISLCYGVGWSCRATSHSDFNLFCGLAFLIGLALHVACIAHAYKQPPAD